MRNRHWYNEDSQRDALDKLGHQLGYKHLDHWYNANARQFSLHNARSFLNRYNNSPSQLIMSTYPIHEWNAFKFQATPNWNNGATRKRFMDWVGEQFGFKNIEDWYGITAKHIVEKGGSGLLRKYGASVSKLVMSIYRTHHWKRSHFANKPRSFWDDKDIQRSFMDELGKQLGFKSLQNWYSVTKNLIIENGGDTLLKKHDGSPSHLVTSIYYKHHWMKSNFVHKPMGFWDSYDNQRNFLDWLGNQLGYKQMDDWYNIHHHQIAENGGWTVFSKYNRSTSKMMMSVYNTHLWNQSKFRHYLSAHYWDQKEHRIALVEYLAKKLYIDDFVDWYRTSLSQIRSVWNHMSVFNKYQLDKLLFEKYPNHTWNKAGLKGGLSTKASQRWLRVTIQQLFSHSEIIENYRHPQLLYPNGQTMELDIYLPKENLAFEYQGEHHYKDIYLMGDLWKQKEKDEEKRMKCKEEGIILIEIPYWWDKRPRSLIATIQQQTSHLEMNRY